MDNTRVYRKTVKTEVNIAAELYRLAADIFGYIVYAVSYAVYLILSAPKSAVIKKCVRFFRKHVVVWLAALGLFLVIGLIGGMEAGLISFAAGVVCCAALLTAGALLSKEE